MPTANILRTIQAFIDLFGSIAMWIAFTLFAIKIMEYYEITFPKRKRRKRHEH